MVVIKENINQDILDLAEEIEAYLKQQDVAADTIDGIAHWWLARQRLQAQMQKVERAVEYLCEQGMIEKHVLADGKAIYMSAKKPVSKRSKKFN